MSELTMLENYDDRRQFQRRPTYRSAELMLRGVPDLKGIACLVLDESDGGVQVELLEALGLPEELTIKFSDTASQLVRRCWAQGNRVGYQYMQLQPVHRPWFDGDQIHPSYLAQLHRDRGKTNNWADLSPKILQLTVGPMGILYPEEPANRSENTERREEHKQQLFDIPAANDGVVQIQNFFGPAFKRFWLK